MDEGQLRSFIDGLRNPMHLTQGLEEWKKGCQIVDVFCMTSQTKRHSGSLELLLKISIGGNCVEPESLRVCPSP